MSHQSRKFYSEALKKSTKINEIIKAIEITWLNNINYTKLLNKWVFKKVVNDWRESQHLISRVNEFRKVGAAISCTKINFEPQT